GPAPPMPPVPAMPWGVPPVPPAPTGGVPPAAGVGAPPAPGPGSGVTGGMPPLPPLGAVGPVGPVAVRVGLGPVEGVGATLAVCEGPVPGDTGEGTLVVGVPEPVGVMVTG